MIQSVNIVGSGNVAGHLDKALADKVRCSMINPRTLEGFDPNADLTIISVSDDAIAKVAKTIKALGYHGLIAHTSGSVPIDILRSTFDHSGVFYPMQTFSKDKTLDYSSIPFFIEASDSDSEEALFLLAKKISPIVNKADSKQRKSLHIAAVFACNFVNHLWSLSGDVLADQGYDFTVLLPLIEETVKKIQVISPVMAQTGPASRGDMNVIESHLDYLSDRPELQKIYQLLSDSILRSRS